METQHLFDEDYFLRGRAKGVSNYEDYRWLGKQTLCSVAVMAKYLGAQVGDNFHDYGCSRGYICRALNELGYPATGHDISEWAIANCDTEVRPFVSNDPINSMADWIICKDVLEHVPFAQLGTEITRIVRYAGKGALIIVPLSDSDRRAYLTPADNADKTHQTRGTLEDWMDWFQDCINERQVACVVSGAYKLPGVKQAADPYPKSCGFITLRRV